MPTFADRVLDCIAKRDTSQAALARAAGVSGASISDWVNTITKPENLKAAPLLRAAAFLEVNPMWLLTGKGQRHITAATFLAVQEPQMRYSSWPFEALDHALVSQLAAADLLRLEGAWILAAKQLGLSVSKRRAA